MTKHATPRNATRHPVRMQREPNVINALARYLPDGPLLMITSAGFTRRGVTRRVQDQLGKRVQVFDGVTPNPRLDDLDDWTQQLRTGAYTGILALGGGSVMDAAKVLSVTLAHAQDRPLHALFRNKQPVEWNAHIPLTVVPTTAGTGAEATPFATVWDPVTLTKFSLDDARLYPETALLDPGLTVGLPPEETYNTGLDTFSHALESLWNRRRTPESRSFSLDALERVVSALPRVLETPASLRDRACMQEASYQAGVAISHTRTALAHAISYPLTLHYGMPHGLACGFTLAAIVQHALDAGLDLNVPTTLLEAAGQQLHALAPAQRALRYATPEQIYALAPDMMAPGRADNFILPVHQTLIRTVLEKALDGST